MMYEDGGGGKEEEVESLLSHKSFSVLDYWWVFDCVARTDGGMAFGGDAPSIVDRMMAMENAASRNWFHLTTIGYQILYVSLLHI